MAFSLPIHNVVSLPGARDARRGRGFVDLDDRVATFPLVPGVVVVSAPRSSHVALIAHLARRLRANRANVLTALDASRGGVHVPVSCELAMQLGVEVPSDASACAETLARAIVERGAHVLLTLPKAETWDGAVVDELARRMSGPTSSSLFVLVTDDPAAAIEASMADQGANETETYVLDPALGEADKLRWLSGVAEEVWTNFSSADLESLDTWWSFVRRLSPKAESTLHGLSDRARRWLGCFVLAGRSLPLSVLATDDASGAVDELVAKGAVVRNESLVTVMPWVFKVQGELDLQDLQGEAAYLLAGPGTTPDPWAYARAAELLVGAGRIDDADVAMDKALRSASDPKAAREIGRTWLEALEAVRGEAGLALRIRAAERALAVGEARDAQRWCESAAAIDATDPTVSLFMGRALASLGDIVAARISLNKALSLTQGAELHAKTFAEIAEVDYLAGQLADATACATRAMSLTKTVTTKLTARNTIGKVLLAEGRWDDADAHFVEDALDASAAAERSSELRARVNRGIALLSKGALDDARAILELVREDGERWGIDQAVAHAHLNLGVIAYSQRDYGGALAHWEATVRYPHSVLGRRLALTAITNLAEVRLFLGLVAHAEHGIAFGRRLLGSESRAPAVRTANLKRVAAQVALARGRLDVARSEIESALVDAEASRDYQTIEVVRAVSVRIALEEGDVRGAEAMLAHAFTTVKSARGKAEFAILTAHRLRAAGKPAFDAARDACALVHGAKEVDLLAEIYLLLATISRDQGNLLEAQAQVGRAVALRDQVAATLPPDVRAAYLAKAEIVAISRLSSSLADCEPKSEDEIVPLSRVAVSSDAGTRELVGDDPSIRALNTAIRKVARSNATVLVRGESGTGKELVAEALHRASDRASGPLVSVNCAALVETLLLSELFGHEKGAFTGASARRRGRFELAEGGTLFLDEIGDISPRTQVALLRVLQEKTFERVGGTQSIRANVRIICATHRDLKAMVERGEFREDLYYRLRGITLEVPALRSRIGDLPKIAEHLLERIATERAESPKTLARDAVELLSRHRWPGNVRELENVLRAVSLFADGSEIHMGDLIDNVDELRELAQSGPASQPPPSLSIRGSLLPPPPTSLSGEVFVGEDDSSGALPEEESGVTSAAYACVRQGTVSLSDMKRQIERDCIARALSETQGNITRAASLLGMKRPRLSQLVKQYGLSAYSSEGSS